MQKEILITKRMKMIIPNLSDAPLVINSINKSKKYLKPWLGWANIEYNEDLLKKDISKYRSNFFIGEEFRYYLWSKKSKSFIGSITLRNVNKKNKTTEIGYWLDADYVGKGYIQEASDCLIRFAFVNLDIKKIRALTYADNKKARKTLNKSGFILEKMVTNKELKEVAIYILEKENFLNGSGTKKE